MNIELNGNHISLKECVSDAIIERKNKQPFKVHELHKMSEQISQMASLKRRRIKRSE